MASRSDSGEFDPGPALRALVAADVDFVVIGGLAALAHGSAYPTFDIDVAYARDRPNLERLARVLSELGAVLRGTPPDLPFLLDAKTLEAGLNFTFATHAGSIDVLGEPAGAPRYDALKRASTPATIEGVAVRVTSIDHLIAMKEAAGRPHDKITAAELRVISDELRAPKEP